MAPVRFDQVNLVVGDLVASGASVRAIVPDPADPR
jgi:hypothetical protein